MARIALAAAAIIFAFPGPAQAQVGGNCTTALGLPCSSLPQQILDYARQALQLEQETTTAIKEVVNTVQLPATLFQDGTNEIANITAIAKQADLLINQTGEFIGNLGDDENYPLPDEPHHQIMKEQNAISNAIGQLGNIIGVANPLMAPRSAILAALNDQSMTADGRLKALQSAQGVGATTGQQLHELETILLGMAQGQHAELLAKHDQHAMSDQWAHQMATMYLPIDTGAAPGY